MPTEIPLFIVQMKTRDTPCQMYSGAISTIPKVTTLVTSQPTLHSTRIKIDGTAIFRLDISIHFKTVIQVWPHQVKCFFCNSTFIWFSYVCICFYSSFLNLKVTCKQYLDLFFISSNLFITLKTIKRILYSFNNLHNPNYSMFKTKSHHAYIIMMINKESYITHKDCIFLQKYCFFNSCVV